MTMPKFVLAGLCGSLGYFQYCFMEPILSLRLEELDFTSGEVGAFFIVLPVTYIFTSLAVGIIPDTVHKRALLISSCLLAGISLMLIGPSHFFDASDNKALTVGLMIAGQALLGFFNPILVIPSLPEMIESAVNEFDESQEIKINDLSSGIFNAFLGFGQIMGPLYGTWMYDATDF